MSTFRHPVGEQPPAVYWRRRLVLGLALLVVIIVILLIIFAPKGAKPTASPTTPAPAATASTPKPATTTAPACDAHDLTVTAKVDSTTYSADSKPQLSFTITNDGSTACTVKAGSDVQVFEITSGPEVYWRSTDCQTGKQPFTKVMQPGDQLSPSAAVAWDRTRSSTSTCAGDRPAVPAKGSSYHLVVTVDGVKSSNSPQFVLE